MISAWGSGPDNNTAPTLILLNFAHDMNVSLLNVAQIYEHSMVNG